MKQFICQTPSCAIAISKAEFPVTMNCPVCQTPLTEAVKSLSQKDLDLIASLPYVIAYPLKRTLLEKHEWTKINLLKDTFQNYLKYVPYLNIWVHLIIVFHHVSLSYEIRLVLSPTI